MCLSPISIPNKNKATYYGGTLYNIGAGFGKWKDNNSEYINVPCGVCKQCIAMKQLDLIQRVQMEAINSKIYMGTITYKNETLPRIYLPDWEDKNGYRHEGYNYRYAKYEDVAEMIKRMRKNNVYGIPFRNVVVSERGSKRQRPHFHILMMFNKEDIPTDYEAINFEKLHKWTLFNEWKRNIGSAKNPLYQQLSEYHESYRAGKLRATYDFHWVNPWLTDGGVTDAAFYVLKYMLKAQNELDTKRALLLNYGPREGYDYYERIKNRIEYSLGFGLRPDFSKQGKDRTITKEICDKDIIDHLKKGIETAKKTGQSYAYYYSPESLKTFPLAEYYKKIGFIYTNSDEEQFYKNKTREEKEQIYLTGSKIESDQKIKQINDFQRILEKTKFDDIADEFDYLFNNV